MIEIKKTLSKEQSEKLLKILHVRFEKNMHRHKGLDWNNVQKKLEAYPSKLWALNEMEQTGGEPDVIELSKTQGEIIFIDCVEESPKGRRNFCYDRKALDDRKEFKPKNSAIDVACDMGIELLNEDQYRCLQRFGDFDTKTSSWIYTPDKIRKLGGALFADRRYDTVFVYHNGASSYYASRGFRGLLKI